MTVISNNRQTGKEKIERILLHTDFSQYSGLKESLAGKLFSQEEPVKKKRSMLTDQDAEFVSAASMLPEVDPWIKRI